jgi:hypothetical protein
MSDIVLMGDPQVAAIPVDEVGEPLMSVGDLPLSLHKEELGEGRLLLRASVAERLGEAAKQLPAGYQLLFVEGWRAPDVQRGYFEQYKETLRATAIGLTSPTRPLPATASLPKTPDRRVARLPAQAHPAGGLTLLSRRSAGWRRRS